MFLKKIAPAIAAAALFIVLRTTAPAEEPIVSTMHLMSGVAASGGITIVPTTDASPNVYTEDLAPPQVFEVIRPDMGPISIGRLTTSCTCIVASMEKRQFSAGERALLTVRNVKATPPQGGNYAVWVQFTSPIQDVIQFETFVKSGASASTPAEPAPIAPYTNISNDPVPTVLYSNPTYEAVPRIRGASVPQPPPFRYEDITPYTRRPEPPKTNEDDQIDPDSGVRFETPTPPAQIQPAPDQNPPAAPQEEPIQLNVTL